MPTKAAKHLLHASVRGLLTADPGEISLLHFLYLVRSAGGLNALLSIEGGYQQDRLAGGAQAMADLMARDLGEAVRPGAAVSEIEQDADGVTVRSATIAVRAKRVVVSVPPSLATRIRYQPALPTDHAQLLDRMPAGALIKIMTVYDEPFWRTDGRSGMSVIMNSPIEMMLDASPKSGAPGVSGVVRLWPARAPTSQDDRRRSATPCPEDTRVRASGPERQIRSRTRSMTGSARNGRAAVVLRISPRAC